MARALMTLVAACVGAGALAACGGTAYEADPVSAYQWQQRQERIERQQAETLRRCETLDKTSERYARECPRAGGAA
jgi:hypothetical protein